MDFLTRLAQRMTGELPVVRPRLPSLFESAAGPARALVESEETAISAVPEPARPMAPAVPAPRPDDAGNLNASHCDGSGNPAAPYSARGAVARAPGRLIEHRAVPPTGEHPRTGQAVALPGTPIPGAGRDRKCPSQPTERGSGSARPSSLHRISLRRGASRLWTSGRSRWMLRPPRPGLAPRRIPVVEWLLRRLMSERNRSMPAYRPKRFRVRQPYTCTSAGSTCAL